MKYKCIIFDCDGVLVDSESISNGVLIAMVEELGGSLNEDYIDEYYAGTALKSIIADVERLITQPLPSDFEQQYRQRTFEAFKTEMKPIAGIHEVLKELTIPFCVASSGPPEKIKLNLTTTELIQYFEHKIFSSYDIGSWKPNPGIFLHAARQMGFQPQDCLVIEDSIAGIEAGVSGGFDVLGYANEKNEEALINAGAQVFFSMDQLQELLSK